MGLSRDRDKVHLEWISPISAVYTSFPLVNEVFSRALFSISLICSANFKTFCSLNWSPVRLLPSPPFSAGGSVIISQAQLERERGREGGRKRGRNEIVVIGRPLPLGKHRVTQDISLLKSSYVNFGAKGCLPHLGERITQREESSIVSLSYLACVRSKAERQLQSSPVISPL